jgi:hypothetical protein
MVPGQKIKGTRGKIILKQLTESNRLPFPKFLKLIDDHLGIIKLSNDFKMTPHCFDVATQS